MSVNVTRTAIELAYEYNIPITLIASRRQVECATLGHGYVNNWTTETFAEFVRGLDPRGLVRLARDHGGPWQGEGEEYLDEAEAMARAVESYRADILSGFTLLHIDPNKNPAGKGGADLQMFTRRTKELLTACHGMAAAAGKKVGFEIGTDEGVIGALPPEQTETFILEIMEFCRAANIPVPEYAVVQTGTKVMERQNVGPMDGWIARAHRLPPGHALPQFVALCQRNGIKLKQHNTDYLSDEALAMHPEWGIDTTNVAPEFGVIETTALVDVLEHHGAGALAAEILDIALESGKWHKWMLPNSTADNAEKSIIAGHYIFAVPKFLEMKTAAARYLAERGVGLDEVLRTAIRRGMERYLQAFNLIGQAPGNIKNVRENLWMASAS